MRHAAHITLLSLPPPPMLAILMPFFHYRYSRADRQVFLLHYIACYYYVAVICIIFRLHHFHHFPSSFLLDAAMPRARAAFC